MRQLKIVFLMVSMLVLSACASGEKRQVSALEKAQYAWTAAIRWGDIAGAWKQVDPEYRATHALTDLEIARYKLVEVTGYNVVDSNTPSATEFERTIDITVVNKKDMSARNVTYHERWRFDAANQVWWVTGGLPNFWDGH